MQRARSVAIFLIITLLLVIPALMLVYSQDKLLLHALLNSRHVEWLDVLAAYLTHLADGWVPAILAIAMLVLKDVRSFLMIGGSAGFSALVVQFMKRMIFGEWDRPFMYKEELGDMGWVIGIEMNHHFSFPSGHATAAFSTCMAVAVIVAQLRWAVVLALVAALLAYTRVYLSQHFLVDIAAGALIGSAMATLMYSILYKGPRSEDERLSKRLRLIRTSNEARSPR
jgi:membrane-associated phospholipid phosphatase